MKFMTTGAILVLTCGLMLSAHSRAAEAVQTLFLWPNGTPGETNKFPEERDMTKPTDNLIAGKPVIRLGNVSKPSITLYRPPADSDTGAAVVVCPGGGYSILAMDLEGTEVCEWLNSVGVTGVLLKYRVPQREGQPAYAAPLQDAQRAVGIVRHRAKELGLDPRRIGILGFSAGAHLSAALSANFNRRTYPVVDDADNENCRPDFQVLIYPGGLNKTNEPQKVVPEAAVATNTPPTFIAMAADDPVRVENALVYALALKQSKIPVELHVYPTGGHGYGLRRSKERVTTWPDRAVEWMQDRSLLERK